MDKQNRIDHYVAALETAQKGEFREEPAWAGALRRSAMSRFAERGFPTLKDEDWKYTSVEGLASVPFAPMEPHQANGVTPSRVRRLAFGMEGAGRLVFVNGRFMGSLSGTRSSAGELRLGSLATLLRDDPERLERVLARHASFDEHPFVALNTALWTDGAFIHIPEGAVLEQPIHVLYLTTSRAAGGVAHPRNLILADKFAQATIVESYAGLSSDQYWSNPVTEVVAGEGAVVAHYKIQRESLSAFHVATLQAHLDRNSRFTTRSISLGGALVRNDVNGVFDGEGGYCRMDGLYLLTGRQHEDNHTLIDHAKPHCSSSELYKGVLDGEARGVFNGAVVVRQDAQQTDARQANRNLLLSDDAVVDTKPQLEILADDVKCAHAATVGQLDETSMFYLRSRGLSEEAARNLLIHAFAAEVIDRIPWKRIRDGLAAELMARLPSYHEPEEGS
jgi:Fe-S cluster assembly protein SufD